MAWPPKIGEPLPRADEVWYERRKLEWILGADGHGPEWKRVFRIGIEDANRVWDRIAQAVPMAPITEIHGKEVAVSYGVLIDIAIDGRFAPVLTAWHYADEAAAPRLVTAYPKPYTRRNGDYG
ncbi:MAG TPA: hypothetical protein VEQ41_04615 [Solirubrobacterales bacterium]|nr:hypothetical protein [Solirubrobacterales bacterium]